MGSDPLASSYLWCPSRLWLVLPGVWFPAVSLPLLPFAVWSPLWLALESCSASFGLIFRVSCAFHLGVSVGLSELRILQLLHLPRTSENLFLTCKTSRRKPMAMGKRWSHCSSPNIKVALCWLENLWKEQGKKPRGSRLAPGLLESLEGSAASLGFRVLFIFHPHQQHPHPQPVIKKFISYFFQLYRELLSKIKPQMVKMMSLCTIYTHTYEAITANKIVRSSVPPKFPHAHVESIHLDPRYFLEFYIDDIIQYVFWGRLFHSAYFWDSAMLICQ